MGALKKLLPSNWYEIKEEEITQVNVKSTSFAATLTIDDRTIKDSFGHVIEKEKIGNIKELIERMIMNGFTVEVKTNNKEEKTWKN